MGDGDGDGARRLVLTMVLKKCATAFSSARRREDAAGRWGEEDRPRKEP